MYARQSVGESLVIWRSYLQTFCREEFDNVFPLGIIRVWLRNSLKLLAFYFVPRLRPEQEAHCSDQFDTPKSAASNYANSTTRRPGSTKIVIVPVRSFVINQEEWFRPITVDNMSVRSRTRKAM